MTVELTRNKNGSYQAGRWLIYKKLGWWYLYCKLDGEYSDYCGMYKTLWQAKIDCNNLDKIGYGS